MKNSSGHWVMGDAAGLVEQRALIYLDGRVGASRALAPQ